jgi:acyl carrier protein
MRRAVGGRLPEYMIPSAFVIMQELPRTATGKVNRRALPEPDTTRPDLETPYVPPTTPLETALARVWRNVVGLDQVGVNDSFFELGGHSLLAVQVVARVREALGVDVPLQAFFESPTVAGLATAMVERWTAQMDERSLADALAEAEKLSRREGAGADE